DRAQAARELGERAGDGAGELPPRAGDDEGHEGERREYAEDEPVGERTRAAVGGEHGVLVECYEGVEVALEVARLAVEAVDGHAGGRRVEEAARFGVDPPGELQLPGLGVVAVLDREPALEVRPELGARARAAAVAHRQP